ncbi:hypothetical protein JRO89_XS05G0008700 [Xanthoceras sorbifolium]|uniref:Uncharacterized protein n=1 Tax=Xanthoceras sorbifolium TaxID=99658 RepID=A0ABQ8HZS2_9ROSI|nr:hypothetical protein JRO89_XS05G0008700 [Xanthoceras sorbifolium]
MDFHYTSQFEDVNEDDAFYAELRRQILLLTADEDEDHEDLLLHRKRPNCVNATEQNSINLMSSSSTMQQPGTGSYFNWWGSSKSYSVPAWLEEQKMREEYSGEWETRLRAIAISMIQRYRN